MVVVDVDVRGFGVFEVAGAAIPDVEEEGGGFALDEVGDHAVERAFFVVLDPIEFPAEDVERPRVGVVALGGNDVFGADDVGDHAGILVGTPDVAGENGYGEPSRGVDVDDGGVGGLGVEEWSDGSHADAEGPDENEVFVVVKFLGGERVDGVCGLGLRMCAERVEFHAGKFLFYLERQAGCPLGGYDYGCFFFFHGFIVFVLSLFRWGCGCRRSGDGCRRG